MAEWRLFDGDPPEWTTPAWYAQRDTVDHLADEGHRPRLELAAHMVQEAVVFEPLLTLVDLGAGDGGLLSLVERLPCPPIASWGYDLQPSNVAAAAERGVHVLQADVVNDEIEWGGIAVATEMLEHLVDPHAFVRKIAERSHVLVASSPWCERPNSHYEFHAWAWDMDGYRALLEQAGWRVARHETTGQFQVILGVRP